jgi:hypothetical protein
MQLPMAPNDGFGTALAHGRRRLFERVFCPVCGEQGALRLISAFFDSNHLNWFQVYGHQAKGTAEEATRWRGGLERGGPRGLVEQALSRRFSRVTTSTVHCEVCMDSSGRAPGDTR